LLIVPKEHKGTLGALLEGYQESKVKCDLLYYNDNLPIETEIANAASDVNNVLFVVPGNRAPQTVISGPFISSGQNKKLPVGILPAKSKKLLQQFALAAHQTHIREKYQPVLALLSQRLPRYLRVSERMESILKSGNTDFPVFKWTSDVVLKEDMLKGVNFGLGVALYVGHGRPVGWVGYYGTRAHHFDEYLLHPLGCMLSLCCHTASRRQTGLSFSEAVVLNGIAASALGAVTKTKHIDNTKGQYILLKAFCREFRR
jgi:hypothetical protein